VTSFTIGAQVSCADKVCGSLERVVIDPVGRVLTHLVVEPKHVRAQGRLVPVGLADSTDREITLRCSAADFAAMEEAEESRFLPGTGEELGYGPGPTLMWPYCGLGGGASGFGAVNGPQVVIDDRVPAGEEELRRGERVHASDGDIGRVHGLVVDSTDHRLTHVLLEEGHLWGRREIAIPIAAVKDVSIDGIRLGLTRDEVRHLPPVLLAKDD
jgi:hypothetical protein